MLLNVASMGQRPVVGRGTRFTVPDATCYKCDCCKNSFFIFN